MTGDDLEDDGDDIDDDCDGATGDEVDDDGSPHKLLSPSMRRRLRRRRDSVAALVVMASLSLTMRRRLAVVDNDGDGVTGDNNYDDFDNATDFAVVAMVDGVVALIAMASLPLPMRRRLAIVNDDGNSATGEKVNDGRRCQR